jgi:nitrate/nitrite transport system substrate-binding protein
MTQNLIFIPLARRLHLEERGTEQTRTQADTRWVSAFFVVGERMERPKKGRIGRRRFLKASLAAAGALALGCDSKPSSSAAGVASNPGSSSPSDGPEVSELKFGMIALTDCSPIVIAHEKGFFKKYGITSVVSKGASWAAIRDSLSNGDLQATHMLIGMPLTSTMGLLGAPKKPMVIPWLMNRNGQSITLGKGFRGKVKDDPKALKPLVDEAKAKGTPMTFAMTFPGGTHAMWMRFYLGAGGIHPDRDIALITIPPPQMIANMKIGKMDGFCVGEPWNARAIADDIGFTSINTQDFWKDHPEKVCAFTAEFAEKNPKTVKAVLKALHEASVWLDHLENRPEQAEIVARPTYINCPKELILGRLLGTYDFGDGRTRKDPNYMIFHERNCNYPQPKYAKWFLTQYRRWGMVEGPPDYEGVARQVMRPDLYEEAMKELGATHGGRDDAAETLFDGSVFDPAKAEAYAASFAVHGMKG